MPSLISTIRLTARTRGVTRNVARVGVVFSAVMLVLSIVTAFGSGPEATAAMGLSNRAESFDSVLDTLPDTVPPETIPATTSTLPASTTTIPAETTTTIVAQMTPTTEPPIAGTPTPYLPRTGSSSLPVAIWAVLLLAFGRMAILFARPLEVLPTESR
jgi:hypothetical protein